MSHVVLPALDLTICRDFTLQLTAKSVRNGMVDSLYKVTLSREDSLD